MRIILANILSQSFIDHRYDYGVEPGTIYNKGQSTFAVVDSDMIFNVYLFEISGWGQTGFN